MTLEAILKAAEEQKIGEEKSLKRWLERAGYPVSTSRYF